MPRRVYEFLRLALLPGRHVVKIVLPIFGPLGVIVAAVTQSWLLAFVVAVVIGLALLVAGVRLLGERDARLAANFTARAKLEPVGWQILVQGVLYEYRWVMWVEVENHGPTSEFSARAVNIGGVPPQWGDDYRLIHPAWEGTTAASQRIERGGMRRIKLAGVLWEPRGFWFLTTQTGKEEPGHQWRLAYDECPKIRFDLSVVNTGANDETVSKRGEIDIPDDLDAVAFRLLDP